jgi:hypothetical protein
MLINSNVKEHSQITKLIFYIQMHIVPKEIERDFTMIHLETPLYYQIKAIYGA